MRTRFTRALLVAALAALPMGGSVQQASAQLPDCNCTSTTTIAPNGDRITRVTFADGTVITVIVKAGAEDALK